MLLLLLIPLLHLPGGSAGKESVCNAQDPGSMTVLGGPLEKGMATYSWLSLPGEFQGQRNLADYISWGCKELDTAE